MKKSIRQFLIIVLGLSTIVSFNTCKQKVKYANAYQNPELTFEERAADLVSKMTLEEKILQMQYEAPAIPGLNIPQYNWWNEALHGVARNGIATVFPQAIGMAATWNPDLIKNEADVISTEARAKYYEAIKSNQRNIYQGLTYWSPNINIFRDPRWGRGQETYGEDPYLTGRIGVSFVKGLQGDDPKYFKIIATPKHYAVHSGPESSRHEYNAITTKRDLWETYLPAFEACIKDAQAFSIMGAYNRYLGEACCASNLLLKEILRDKWGFKGYVVSDCGAIGDIYRGHKLANDMAGAAALAVKAGCDLTCGGEYASLKEAVQKGLITEKEIDVAVTRLMLARFKLGLFDPDEMVPYSKIPVTANDTKENREVAKKVALESMVLLKNEKNILPLDKNKIKTLALIGPNAEETKVLLGNYSGVPSKAVSVLEGLKNKLGAERNLLYAKGCDLFIPDFIGEPIPSVNLKGGLKGEYFNNRKLEGTPVLVREDKNVDFDWDYGSPDPKVDKDNFSVRWTGKLVPSTSDNYVLLFRGDEGYRVFINDKPVLDRWPDNGTNTRSAKMNMTAGKEYDIRIEYYEHQHNANASLMWNYKGAVLNHKKEMDKKGKEEFAKAKEIAAKSDAIVFVGGISPELEGEEMEVHVEGFSGGDRTNINMPEVQENFIKQLCSLGKPVILVLMNGSALAINWEKENIPAILEAWYPGEEGGNAVADILFGDYNPSGRLPITFYNSVKELPAFDDYSMKNRTYRYFNGKLIYSFGHGLSYTNFEYSDLKLSKNNINSKESATVSVNIKNTGNYDGEEVVQLYVRKQSTDDSQQSTVNKLYPIKSLRGFSKINLKKGETKTVQIELKAEDLRYFDEQKNDFVVEPGKYEIQVGASSDDIKLHETLEVK
jgi:beta-glucosidase